jgi:hypothetical protein
VLSIVLVPTAIAVIISLSCVLVACFDEPQRASTLLIEALTGSAAAAAWMTFLAAWIGAL